MQEHPVRRGRRWRHVCAALLGSVVAAGTWLTAQSPSSMRVPQFRKVILDGAFRAEGVALADVNRDGRIDVLAGNAWYAAPAPEALLAPSAWTRHDIAPLEAFDAPTGFSNAFHTFALDVNGDGWPDQVIFGFPGEPATWRANPGPRGGTWRTHLLSASTGYFTAGIALAAGSGALLLVQFAAGAAIRPGAIGALAIGVAAALFAAGTLLLAELPWTALPLLLAVPAVGAVPLPRPWSPRARLVVRTVAAAGAAALPVLAAWVAARAVPS